MTSSRRHSTHDRSMSSPTSSRRSSSPAAQAADQRRAARRLPLRRRQFLDCCRARDQELARHARSRPSRSALPAIPNSEHLRRRRDRTHARHRPTRDRVLTADAIELGHPLGTVLDEPNADSLLPPDLPTLSGFARRARHGCASGDGGDEMFGGYGRYFCDGRRRERKSARGLSPWPGGVPAKCTGRAASWFIPTIS